MPLPDNRLALLVGDASGKGLPAALMMANVQSSLRTAALFTGDDLAELLKEDLVRLIFSFMDDFSRQRQTDDATLAVLRVL